MSVPLTQALGSDETTSFFNRLSAHIWTQPDCVGQIDRFSEWVSYELDPVA